MRRFLHSLFGILTILAAFCTVLFFVALYASPAFPRGEKYTFYQGTSSSPMAETEFPLLTKLRLNGAKGESTVYEGDCYSFLKEEFQAVLLWEEEAANVKNFYLYSARLPGGVEINGRLVNLHIAVREESTVVGTPLIFGGY